MRDAYKLTYVIIALLASLTPHRAWGWGSARHLGHVFRNEGFPNPPPNERHCVNGVSIAFVPEGKDVSEAILPTYDGAVYEG